MLINRGVDHDPIHSPYRGDCLRRRLLVKRLDGCALGCPVLAGLFLAVRG